MSLPAPNLYFASPHPWSAAIRSFSDLSFLALVLQIEDADDAFAKLRFANEKSLSAGDQMAVAQRLKSIFSKCVVIDATPTFLHAIDRKTLHAATVHIRKQFMDMSVGKGLELVRGLLIGSPIADGVLPKTVRSPKMRLTIHARNGQSGQLQILVSVSTDADSNPPVIGNKLLHSLLDSSAHMLVGISLDGRVSYMNQGMAEIYEPRYFERRLEIADILTPESSVRFTQVSIIISMSNEPWLGILEFLHPETGVSIPSKCRISLASDTVEQRVSGYVISADRVDLSREKLAETKIIADAPSRGSHFDLVGKIATDMIYDANGALGVIESKADGLIRLAEKHLSDPSLAHVKKMLIEETKKISMMGERIQRIVDVIDGLAQDGSHEKSESVDLAHLLAEVSDLVQHFAKNLGVTVEIERPQQELRVPMQRLRISQVLTNLLINACEAVQGLPEKSVRLSLICDEEWIYLLVTDSGPSIPQPIRVRLFEHRFTTKKEGVRTGVGLFLSRQVAREHGGDLYFDETSEKTRFVLELPLVKDVDRDTDETWEEI